MEWNVYVYTLHVGCHVTWVECVCIHAYTCDGMCIHMSNVPLWDMSCDMGMWNVYAHAYMHAHVGCHVTW